MPKRGVDAAATSRMARRDVRMPKRGGDAAATEPRSQSVCDAALLRRTILLALLGQFLLALDRRDKKKDS